MASHVNEVRARLSAISRRERWLWLAGIGLWLVGDLAITAVEASRGIIGWNGIVVDVAAATGVPPIWLLFLGKLASVGLAGVAFGMLDWELRFLIPAGYVFIGLLTIAGDLQTISTLLF